MLGKQKKRQFIAVPTGNEVWASKFREKLRELEELVVNMPDGISGNVQVSGLGSGVDTISLNGITKIKASLWTTTEL